MISSTLQKIFKILSHARSFSYCAALTSPKQVSQVKNYPKLLPLYKVDVSSQKKKKILKDKKPRKRIVIKRVSDDIEAVWLENLNISNLALYRKTSYGSFRKINLESLLLRLKEIYPSTFKTKTSLDVIPTTPSKWKSKQRSRYVKFQKTVEKPSERDEVKDISDEGGISSPYLSEYLIKNIIDFPLLKTTDSVTERVATEVENFGDVDVQTFPSVSTILNDTMSVEAKMRLKFWKKKMTEELGEEGFMKFQRDMLTQGTKFHSTIKSYLEVPDKRLVTVPPEVEGCWKSVEKVLPDLSDVLYTEESVYHPFLKYKGIVDCVAHYRGVPCVIEWKRSTRAKTNLSSTYDAPLQLCAYLGAIMWHKNVAIQNGLVVIAYVSGAPANVFHMPLESCETYWVEWLKRVQTYWLKKCPTLVQNEM